MQSLSQQTPNKKTIMTAEIEANARGKDRLFIKKRVRNPPIMANSPWAKLGISKTPKIKVNPTAVSERIPPKTIPVRRFPKSDCQKTSVPIFPSFRPEEESHRCAKPH